jgi:hypothetical protein
MGSFTIKEDIYIPSIYIDMEELFTLPEHLSSPPVCSWVRVVRSLVFCVVFCRSLFFCFFPFSFSHCLVCPSIYEWIFGIFKLFLILKLQYKRCYLNPLFFIGSNRWPSVTGRSRLIKASTMRRVIMYYISVVWRSCDVIIWNTTCTGNQSLITSV